jgi:NADPH:quinone reductase-like Zn-dependent oxidoreductase/acyl carrier protein
VLADDPPADSAAAALWGFGRAIAVESPELFAGLVDVEQKTSAASLAALVSVLHDAYPAENQLAVRKGTARAARLVHARQPAKDSMPPEAYYLAVGARHTLDDLSFQPRPRVAPAAHEVEVEIHAAGLNFRDVLNALGQYPGDAGLMGFEAVGIVAAVGSGVTGLQEGDEVVVMAAPGCIGSFHTVDARFVLPKPRGLTFEEAVTLPATFLTAWYALHVLGHIGSGDRILIHAAAGGVGLAAVQIARAAGAEVFATAGSEEKRAYLRSLGVEHVMSSRTLDFADEIAERTRGAGVSMVLNSLNGDFIPRSFDVLAPHGRFLEMGKIGVWDQERVRAHHPTAEYRPFDLAAVARVSPALILEMWNDVVTLAGEGTLKPLPATVFPMSDATEAFRYMAQARHIGKIVLSRAEEIRRREPLIRGNATYLITGGLGALGIAVAQWLGEKGARHIVLAGRRGPDARAEAAIATLRESGVEVLTAQANVAEREDVERLAARIRAFMPPLRGVIHAAGMLDDGMLRDQSWERFRRVMEPKAVGAWNLHQATRQDRLDLFVCFSSIAAIIGNLGQSNYAAANAFLDALAAARRKLGLAATSINWGPWAGAGMAASLGDERFTAQGIRFLDPAAALRALEVVLRDGLTQCAVADVDWQRWAAHHDIDARGGLFAELVSPTTKSAPPSTSPKRDIAGELRDALPIERRNLLQRFLQSLAREVLGYGESEVIAADRPLGDQGFDSLMTVDMRNRLSKILGATLPASLLFDHPTIERVADYLLRDVIRIGDDAPATDALLEEIDHLVHSR